MVERESVSTEAFTPINRNTQFALGRYALIHKTLEFVQNEVRAADEAIEQINRGLPEGYKVGTKSSWSPEVLNNGYGGSNTIYRPNDSGEYVAAGEICTDGAALPFLGDRILKTGDGLVVINDELQLGMSVMGEVFVIDTTNDPSKRSIGGTQQERFEERLLPLIQQVEPGTSTTYDCSYY